MIDRVVAANDLAASLDRLTAEGHVVAPVRNGPQFRFARVANAEEIADGYLPTQLPPTKYLLPPREVLLRFDWHERLTVDPVLESEDVLAVGLRPCDLHALELLDRIFVEDKDDDHYRIRRERLLLVGVECLAPCDEHCFCESMGTLRADTGYDVLLTDIGDAWFIRVGTQKGKEFALGIDGVKDAAYEDRSRLRKAHEARDAAFTPRLDVTFEQLPGLLAESSDSLLWDVLGEKCLSCGACTNVCPTCYCFDVRDTVDLDLHGGERFRTWDSCQLEEFAMVGTGESFRQPREMRVKHRFNRKGRYIFERYGLHGCVGCGRCARSCLVDIDPVEVFNQLKGRPVER